ncbi:MAG: sugar phosphate isomerase/epimerase [Candidatus Firestonebacteria bacterium]|nr:sugar phosphate isomerase/epimerase [Candidatus Firestonebacteria bacterium]
MFKLAIFSDEVSQNVKEVAAFCRKWKLEAVEIRTLLNKGPHNFSKEEIKLIKTVLKDNGIKVCSIASPFFKCTIDNKKEYEQHLDILKNCIDLAGATGAKIIRGFTFWRTGIAEENLDRVAEYFPEPVKLMKKAKMVLGIENEPATFVGCARTQKIFLEKIHSPAVKAIWDPGNEVMDADGIAPFPNGYRLVKDEIIHIHLKDALSMGYEGKAECVPMGEGQVNYWGQFKALIEDGYSGYLSLETHWRINKAEIKKMSIEKPGGAGWSFGAKESSEYCMRNIMKMLGSLKK